MGLLRMEDQTVEQSSVWYYPAQNSRDDTQSKSVTRISTARRLRVPRNKTGGFLQFQGQ